MSGGAEGAGRMSERRHEWTDPHPDHGGVTHWIDENGEWNAEEPIPIASFERVLSEIAYCEHLAALLDDRRADGWVSVSDRLPERDGVYVTFRYAPKRDEVAYAVAFFAGGIWGFPDVTHWRPLPAPPEVEP